MTRWYRTSRVVLRAVLIGMASWPAWAGPRAAITPDAVDGIVKPLMEKAKIPGLAIAIQTADNKIVERSYGFANLEHQLPVTGTEMQPDVVTLVNDNTVFALDLYQQLKTNTEGNIFFSPHSISTALAMTYAGARGNTEKQMVKALHLSLAQNSLHPAFAALEARLNQAGKAGRVKMLAANSLWPQQDYKFLAEYLKLVQRCYNAAITPLDYRSDRDTAQKTINNWVEERTQGKIRDIIPAGMLNELTRLVLVNAIYFKGNWANQFKAGQTEDAPFCLSPGKSVQTRMMTQKQKFRYAELDELQLLELPYAGNALSMLVLLPRESNGLARLEKDLTFENLGQWESRLRQTEVVVFLPKFKLTSHFWLNAALASMGMADAFSPKADFSGMDGSNWLYISAAIHKAYVDVNEEGTEAAAATAVVVTARAMPSRPPIFRADHPFLFLIRENTTRSILFMGRVIDPTIAAE